MFPLSSIFFEMKVYYHSFLLRFDSIVHEHLNWQFIETITFTFEWWKNETLTHTLISNRKRMTPKQKSDKKNRNSLKLIYKPSFDPVHFNPIYFKLNWWIYEAMHQTDSFPSSLNYSRSIDAMMITFFPALRHMFRLCTPVGLPRKPYKKLWKRNKGIQKKKK